MNQGFLNPDLFIRLDLARYLRRIGGGILDQTRRRMDDLQDQGTEQIILVVEIKHDEDDSEQTRGKEAHGKDHFTGLNRRLRRVNPIDLQEPFREAVNQQYAFYLLHPAEYAGWFASLRDGRLALDVPVDLDAGGSGPDE